MKLATMQAELAKTKQREQELLKEIEKEQAKFIRGLPALAGFKSVDELVIALAPHASSYLKVRLRSGKGFDKLSRASGLRGSVGGEKREHFTDELKERVKADMKDGKKTMARISEEHGPSIFTLRLWKRQWGLTRRMGIKK